MEIEGWDSFLTDAFVGEDEVVGVTRGDIYDGEVPVAHYLAAWFPTSLRELVLLVTVGEGTLKNWKPRLAVAVRCPVGDASRFRVVQPEEQPWGDYIAECVGPSAVATMPSAERAVKLVPFILKEDPSLADYLAATEPIPVSPDDVQHDD